ncbi:hypothetical protein LXL04_024999 [Taraxacum kok-saghyz]
MLFAYVGTFKMIIIFLFSFLFISCLPSLYSATDYTTTSMPICPKSFSCPNSPPFNYPLYNATDSHCGLIKVNCTSNGTELEFREQLYEIGVNAGHDSYILVRNIMFEKLVNDRKCDAFTYDFTSPSPLLYSVLIIPFAQFYKCTKAPKHVAIMEAYFNQSTYNRYKGCRDHNFYYKYNISDTTIVSDLPHTCQVIRLPVNVPWEGNIVPEKTNIFSLLSSKFFISFRVSPSCHDCRKKHGMCDTHDGRFRCLDAKKEKPLTRRIRVLAGSVSLVVFFLVIFIIWRLYKSNRLSYFSSKEKSPNVEDGSIFSGVSFFSYNELEDATQNFNPSQELGNGGFGAVYYGKLQDGREVAVKRLYEHNYKRVQQFMNEVQILTRLRHPNLVVLYGCTTRQSHELLLVYEYISNGTIYDHLHGNLSNLRLLTWPLRMNVAIETAKALVYLHASEIIHRDVKTTNILLDHSFGAKVADFGVSRILPNNVTHVSTAPQGTPGYVDPQYHHRYQLTDKSDVYSFGVVLIELISSMRAFDLNRHDDEICLANMALNRIQSGALDQLIDPVLGSHTDPEIMRMITSVAELAFRCLQFYSEIRPTMNEVLIVLEDIQVEGRIDTDESIKKSETSDMTVLLKDFPPSPVSFTTEGHSLDQLHYRCHIDFSLDQENVCK